MKLSKLNPGDLFKWGDSNAEVLSYDGKKYVTAQLTGAGNFLIDKSIDVEVVAHKTTFGNVDPGMFFTFRGDQYVKTIHAAICLNHYGWSNEQIENDAEVIVVNKVNQ